MGFLLPVKKLCKLLFLLISYLCFLCYLLSTLIHMRAHHVHVNRGFEKVRVTG